ncbi:MAG: hypothetical protein K9L68_08705 [Spirochaetales bacterium]|nr:hypothetical protein [Spirochaetales bacterium]
MIVGLLSVMSVTAEGAQERWDRTAPAQSPYYNSERISVSGTVELTAGGVELKATNGQEYELMYPRYLAEDVQVRDGDTVAVEGYLVPGPRWDWGEDENHLRVDKVTLNGKEYDLAGNFGPGYGSRGGCWGYGNSNYGPQGGAYGPGARGSMGGYGGRGLGMMGRW